MDTHTRPLLLPAVEHMCACEFEYKTHHERENNRSSPHTQGTTPSLSQAATGILVGGGGTTNSRTLASSTHWDYFFFPLPPLFSKTFCLSCAVGILVAAQLELMERVAGPVRTSSWVLPVGLGVFTPWVFR